MTKNKTKNIISYTVLGMVLLVLCLLSLRSGSAKMTHSEFFTALSDINMQTNFGIILYSVRLPRLMASVIAGAGLGISGTILQCITGNKMASPGLIGVNSGAGFAVILSLSAAPSLFGFVPLFAFAGAFLATLFIITLSEKIGMTKNTVILVGLAFSAILSAGISFISLIDSDVLVAYNAFSIGSLSGVGADALVLPAVITAFTFVASIMMSKKMDLLSLGDGAAIGLGVNVVRVRKICMILACAGASAAVSFAGLLGFVGLMSSHIARLFVKENMKNLLPASALIGAILVTGADLLGRVAFAPGELPVGIFMSLVGAPFFLCLLLFKGGKSHARD